MLCTTSITEEETHSQVYLAPAPAGPTSRSIQVLSHISLPCTLR